VLLNCSAGIKIKGVCPSSIVEINYDMRYAYCSLDIQSSSPKRRQTKDCGEPNLYEVTAEKDAVRIPQTPRPPYDFQTVWACFENSGFPNE